MKTYVFLVSTDTFSFYHLTDASHKTWAQKGLFSQSQTRLSGLSLSDGIGKLLFKCHL